MVFITITPVQRLPRLVVYVHAAEERMYGVDRLLNSDSPCVVFLKQPSKYPPSFQKVSVGYKIGSQRFDQPYSIVPQQRVLRQL